ncbi:MAG: hypothetical protein DWH94_01945 [Planctomycetota bacterium]|nr:MAG: hypothetical protein DWH94_01945 [Planctomycetota bacterium]
MAKHRSIELNWGDSKPIVLELSGKTIVADCRAPQGLSGVAARDRIVAALESAAHGPPLSRHVVPGDRVVIAIAGDLPQEAFVREAMIQTLTSAGVSMDDTVFVRSQSEIKGTETPDASQESASPKASGKIKPSGKQSSPVRKSARARTLKMSPRPREEIFHGENNQQSGYLNANDQDKPLYLSRHLIDADVVVPVGEWRWDPLLCGRSIEGELWPTFSRRDARRQILRALLEKRLQTLQSWRRDVVAVNWHLGIVSSLKMIAGANDSLASVAFGNPVEVTVETRSQARKLWSPDVVGEADVSIAAVSGKSKGFLSIVRAAAAAARLTNQQGTVCVCSQCDEAPGVVFTRWRQGAGLRAIVDEALESGDEKLEQDALTSWLFSRALGDRRLVLLSSLDESIVEELECGFAATPEAIERLAHDSSSVAILHEADRMLPRFEGL